MNEGDTVEVCYTGDLIWHRTKIVKIHKKAPRYEVEDYLAPGTVRVGKSFLREIVSRVCPSCKDRAPNGCNYCNSGGL